MIKYITGWFVIMLMVYKQVSAQTVFSKYPGNPVMKPGIAFLEDRGIGSPSVIIVQDTFRMFYAMGGADLKGRIGYAYSIDGIHWIKKGAILEPDAQSPWESFFLDTPEIIKDQSGYKLYYFADTDNNPVGGSFGVAVSTDLIHWNRVQNTPILQPGQAGEWDELFIESPSVTYINGMYYMVYSGIDTQWRVRIGLATSTDGIHWTKYVGNPILEPGNNNQWDDFSIATPSILYQTNQFMLWYCGVSVADWTDNQNIDTVKIGYATSLNGIHWLKYDQNPVLNTYSSPYTNFEKRGPWAPDIVYSSKNNQYLMWYETAYGFGLAIAPDNEQLKNETFIIYPNPATSGVINIISKNRATLFIYNYLGEKILENTVLQPGYNQIHLKNLPTGIYFVQMSNPKHTTIKKIIFIKSQ